MNHNPDNKHKIAYFLEGKGNWQPEKPAEYMIKMTRKQASTIFRARTRMIKIKGNYKNGHSEHICRACKTEEETQQHILKECIALHHGRGPEINPFVEDVNQLRDTATRIEEIIHELEDDRRT